MIMQGTVQGNLEKVDRGGKPILRTGMDFAMLKTGVGGKGLL